MESFDTQKVHEMNAQIIRHGEQIKTLFANTAENRSLAESVHKLATSVEILALEQKTTVEKLDALSRDVESIKDRPSRRWEDAVKVIFTVVITAMLTCVLASIGLK